MTATTERGTYNRSGEARDSKAEWPRVTLVTAVYNGEKYLEATIRSIVGQGYPNLEYIIVDDGSTDATVEIIRKYESQLTCWFSQENRGLYAALNAGFARSTGEIMGWLNSSDLLHVNGLFVVGSVFAALREVEWITGRPSSFSAHGMTINVAEVPRWSRYRFLAGANIFIQQESTYWRRGLWERAGGALSTEFRAEGDCELWTRFFRHAKLHSVDALIAGYRRHEDALTSSDMDGYVRRCDEIAGRAVESVERPRWRSLLKAFRWVTRVVKPIPKVRGFWHLAAINSLYTVRGPDWPPVIEWDDRQWRFRRK
jgi:glycosyltransferase involved in cell wall biosynthesis